MSIPDDDWTHPIADLTGYITEGQIAIARDLHRKAIFPPVDPLPSLSRLMDAGIGKGRTREDHKQVADQLYAAYAEGKDVRGLVAIVGKEALSDRDRKMLEFADRFEQEFIRQGAEEDRTIEQTLEIGWALLATLDEAWLMGIVVPKIDAKAVRKTIGQRGYGIVGTSPRIDEAAEAYENLVEDVITAAEIETTMRRLIEEIEKVKRRVNALEYRVIPELKATERFIRQRLEEMERDTFMRHTGAPGRSRRPPDTHSYPVGGAPSSHQVGSASGRRSPRDRSPSGS